jgi:hypothetical protein
MKCAFWASTVIATKPERATMERMRIFDFFIGYF